MLISPKAASRAAWLAGFLAVAGLGACDSSSGPQPQVAARLNVVSGDAQQARVGTELPEPLVVEVLDQRGKPVAGLVVNFRVVSGGGTVFAGAANTNKDGQARERWTLGTSTAPADSQRVEVRAVDAVTGAPLVFATFRATATPDVAASVAAVAPSTRAAVAGEVVVDSLVVRVADRYGNPVPGASVTWAAGQGGSVSPATSVTRADGTARSRWTLGSAAGPQSATGTVAGLAPATFTAVAGSGGVARVEATPESIRFNAIGRTQALMVAAFDRFGNPVQGVPAQLVSLDASVVALDGATARAVGTGTTRIVASVPGSAAADTIVVVVQQVARTVTISNGPETLAVGDTARLAASAADSSGAPIRSADVRWSSSAPGVATVDGSGLVTGVGGGQVTISASVDGVVASRVITVVPAFRAASLDVGGLESCAVGVDGATYCWGYYAEGARAGASTPSQTASGLSFASVTVGGGHRCGVTSAGTAYCWGITDRGQVGTRTGNTRCRISLFTGYRCALQPVQVDGGITWSSLSAGDDHTCGVARGGAAYCWGLNDFGQVGTTVADSICHIESTGTDDRACVPSPAPVSGGITFRMVSAGGNHSCGVATDGAVYCWGANASGQLGDGTTTATRAPVRAAPGRAFTSVSAGQNHTCGVTTQAEIYCWGANGSGQLGDGTLAAKTAPVRVSGGGTWREVSAGRLHSCGVTTDGAALCWGTNAEGQIGDGTSGGQRTTPTPVAGGLRFTTISVSGGYAGLARDRGTTTEGGHTCAIASNSAVYCWGANQYGQIGDGSTSARSAPVRLVLVP